MKKKNLTPQARRYTVTLDTQKATMSGYANWQTFRLESVSRGVFRIETLSNAGGNGQTWDYAGYLNFSSRYMLASAANGLELACLTVLARRFGVSFEDETRLLFPRSRVFVPVGKATAAPTLLQRGHRKGRKKSAVRDKNRNKAREQARSIDLAAAMAERS